MCMKKHASLRNLRDHTNFLHFSFTTTCLEVVFNSFYCYHCDVKNNKFSIVSPTSKKMSAIISTTPQSRPTSTPAYFSISPSTRLLVLAIFARLLEVHIIPQPHTSTLWRINPNCVHKV